MGSIRSVFFEWNGYLRDLHVLKHSFPTPRSSALPQSRADDDATRLIRRAGTALADARVGGGEGIRIFSSEKRSRQVDADQLETDLRLALDRGEIGILFQPQYPVAGEHMIGVEALARWNHPQYGALWAGMLFATAGRSDYMIGIASVGER